MPRSVRLLYVLAIVIIASMLLAGSTIAIGLWLVFATVVTCAVVATEVTEVGIAGAATATAAIVAGFVLLEPTDALAACLAFALVGSARWQLAAFASASPAMPTDDEDAQRVIPPVEPVVEPTPPASPRRRATARPAALER